LLVGARKLGGVLIEARWRGARLDWVAIGVGINRRVPADVLGAIAVRPDVSRDTLLEQVAPALRRAAARVGMLSAAELTAWRARDAAVGRPVVAPVEGIVTGLTANGSIGIRAPDGHEHACQSGSLIFAD
jgi:BirA family biotin operon repressor/biotin-[acetyl-CoA-carboxylase] ligase